MRDNIILNMELINYEYILFLINKFFFGVFTFFVLDIILQLGLLGFKLKEKWINFLKSKDSIYLIIILGFLFYLFFNYPFELFHTAYAASEEELAKATVEANNIKISNIDTAIRYGTEASVYSTGIYAFSRLAKNSSLPLGSKVIAGVATGAVSLLAYKIVQSGLSYNKPENKIIIEAKDVKSSATISSSEAEKLINNTKDKSFPAKSMLDPTDNIGDKDYYIISQQGVDILTWDFFLHLAIIVLIINVILFIFMKTMSDYNINLDFTKNLPLGKYIYIILNKLKNLWSKTTLIWIFVWLFVILIGTCISGWSIYIILSNLG